ncbi:MAG: succinate dehydrogenase iron-sulfur subunit [Anaerolineaceae bacterium]|jgi:succinate dehydrogenase / fumarate reductase iron-sulfur subunit
MIVQLKVFRFDPEKMKKPRYDIFSIEANPTDRVLDLLEQVRADIDGALAYRRSCAHGVCGSDAMRINGRNYLACKVLIRDLKPGRITIEPLLGLRIIKDLVVDMEPFFDHYRKIMPYLINDEPVSADEERIQTQAQRARFDDTTKCILCAACTTACPPFWSNQQYVGPAALVNAHRFLFDSRDRAAEQRLDLLSDRDGVWRCRTAFNCTEACPREIKITQAIAEIKTAIQTGKIE